KTVGLSGSPKAASPDWAAFARVLAEKAKARLWPNACPQCLGVRAAHPDGMSQVISVQSLKKAEGMGFEPTTGFPAPDFESGRSPIRLPSKGRLPATTAGAVRSCAFALLVI